MKPSNAARVAGGELRQLGAHPIAVGDEVQMLLGPRPADPVERIQALELHVLVQVAGRAAANVSSSTHGIVTSDGPVSQVKPPSRSW